MVYYGFTQLDALLQMWASFGVFSVLIPFVLVFAVVFAILQKSKILGSNQGVDIVISIAVGLLALQWDFMPRFFSELFPRLGMAIAVLLALVILVGMFIWEEDQAVYYRILSGIAAVIFVIMLTQTYGGFGWVNSTWWYQWGSLIVAVIAILLVIVLVTTLNSNKDKKTKD